MMQHGDMGAFGHSGRPVPHISARFSWRHLASSNCSLANRRASAMASTTSVARRCATMPTTLDESERLRKKQRSPARNAPRPNPARIVIPRHLLHRPLPKLPSVERMAIRFVLTTHPSTWHGDSSGTQKSPQSNMGIWGGMAKPNPIPGGRLIERNMRLAPAGPRESLRNHGHDWFDRSRRGISTGWRPLAVSHPAMLPPAITLVDGAIG